jgi:hypothetical protein
MTAVMTSTSTCPVTLRLVEMLAGAPVQLEKQRALDRADRAARRNAPYHRVGMWDAILRSDLPLAVSAVEEVSRNHAVMPAACGPAVMDLLAARLEGAASSEERESLARLRSVFSDHFGRIPDFYRQLTAVLHVMDTRREQGSA